MILVNEANVLDNPKKTTKFGIKVFRDTYFFYILAINVLRKCSKCFVYT